MQFPPPLSESDRQVVETSLGKAIGHIEFASGFALFQSPVWVAIGASDAALEFQGAYTNYRQRGVGTVDDLNVLANQVKAELGDKSGTEAVKAMVAAFEAVLTRILKSHPGPAG